METNRKNKLVLEKVLLHFDFIFDLNYSIKEIKEKKLYTDDRFIVISFESNNIKFNITFMSKNAKNEDYNSIFCSLINSNIDGWGRFLSLKEYFKKHYIEYDKNKLNYFNYEGNFEKRIEKVIIEFSILFNNELFDILTGKKWYLDCYTEP